MPMNTQITRDGELRMLRWGDFHLLALSKAIEAEAPEEEMWIFWPVNKFEWTFTDEHLYKDVTDGELFEILPGDVYKFWRD